MLSTNILRSLGWQRAILPLAVMTLGALLAVLPLPWGAMLIGGAAFGLALIIWPELGLYLLPLAVPFGSLREVAVGGLQASATEVLLAATLAAWTARMLATRRLDFGQPVLLWPLLGFVGAVALSLTQAAALMPAIKETAKWLEMGAVYLAVCGLVRSRRQAGLLVGALLLAGSAEALLGLIMAVRRIGPPAFAILGGRLYRAPGTFGQPNPFGGYMNMAWPLAASLAVGILLSSLGRAQASAHKTILLLASLAAGLTMGAGLVASWSRGAWLGAAVGGGVLVVAWLLVALHGETRAAGPSRSRHRAAGWIALAGGLVLLATLGSAFNLIPSAVTGRLESTVAYFGGFDPTNVEVTDENFATVERVAHWWAAAGMWAAHPWLGVGIGNYATAYPRYSLPRWTDPLGHAHNYYLNVGAETGLLGFVMYLALMGAAFAHAARVAWRSRDWLARSIAIAALAVLAATAVHSFFDNLYVHDMAVQLGLLLGLVTATRAQGDRVTG